MLQEAGDPPGSALVILHSVLEAAVSLALLAANLSTLDRRFILHLHYPLSSSLMDTSTLVRSCPLKCSTSATVSLHVGENCVPVSCVAWVSPMGRFAPRLRWLGTKASVFVLFLGCLPFLVPCVLCRCHIEYSTAGYSLRFAQPVPSKQAQARHSADSTTGDPRQTARCDQPPGHRNPANRPRPLAAACCLLHAAWV